MNTNLNTPSALALQAARLLGLGLALGLAGLSMTACQGGGAKTGMSAEQKENAIVHQGITPQDMAAAQSREPVTADAVTLWVNGLGCPQCASAIDLQLARVAGVRDVRVDLSVGKVDLVITGKARPSAWQLGEAVKDAGFTLVKIQTH
jgi:copper chaperone CopZ